MRVSSSSLSNFEECPRMYEAKYVLEIDEPFSERGALGSAFHETVSKTYDASYDTGSFDRQEVIKTYHELRAKYPNISDEVWQEGFPLLQRWYTGVTRRRWLVKPDLCEYKFVFEIAPGIDISGKIDLVITVRDKTYIIDWKTARGTPNVERLKTEPQMMFYAMACKKLFDIDGKPVLYYVRTDGAYSFEYQIPDYRSLMQRVLVMQETVQGGEYEATKNDSCRYCPLYEECETRRQRKSRKYK